MTSSTSTRTYTYIHTCIPSASTYFNLNHISCILCVKLLMSIYILDPHFSLSTAETPISNLELSSAPYSYRGTFGI